MNEDSFSTLQAQAHSYGREVRERPNNLAKYIIGGILVSSSVFYGFGYLLGSAHTSTEMNYKKLKENIVVIPSPIQGVPPRVLEEIPPTLEKNIENVPYMYPKESEKPEILLVPNGSI